MFFLRSLFFALLILCCLPVHTQVNFTDRYPGTVQGARQLLNYILESDFEERRVITRELRPTLEDCEYIFEGSLGKKVYRYQRKLDRQAGIVIQPLLKSQTDLLLWHATTSELLEYSGEAKNFPGGYHELAQYMSPGLTFYRFKFIQPGRYLGSAYDMLIFVNGHWRIIHRPWAVMVGQY
ncbi:MAG: hypothetical protein R3C61_12820 [Bacteroidia bacterium]